MELLLDRLVRFLHELRRRRVYGVSVVAAAVAWGVIEVASVVLATFHAPDWVMQFVLVAAIVGVVTSILLAWIYKIGPEGIERDVAIPKPLVAPDSVGDEKPSLVVLPFIDLDPDSTNSYVGDGLMELLIARLAAIRSLSVISRTTASQYRGTHKVIPQIAGELNVRYLIEGSILRSGEQLQVVVQLIDGRTDRHLWSETYSRPLNDLLTLLNEIAATVAGEVSVTLTPSEAARLARAQSLEPAALDAYLKGCHFLSRRSAENFRKALSAFNQAIEIVPHFSAAYARVSDIQIMSALYGFTRPLDSFPLARASAEKAIALDASSAEALSSRGTVRMFADWDFPGAEKDFLRSLAINPSYPMAHLAYGDLLWIFGRGEAALDHMWKAVRVDPLDLGMNMNLGDFLMFAGRFAESAAQHRRGLEFNPDFIPSRVRLARVLALAGDGKGALAELDRLQAAAPRPIWLEASVLTHALLGNRDQARAALDTWRGESDVRLPPLQVAWAYAALGEHDAAIEWLEKSLEERSPALIFCHVQPAFRSLKADARFQAVLQRIGIPATPSKESSATA